MQRVCRLQVRYAAVRRQTAAHAGELEVQVLDYQNTAADLLPLLAQAYALLFMVLPQPTQPERDRVKVVLPGRYQRGHHCASVGKAFNPYHTACALSLSLSVTPGANSEHCPRLVQGKSGMDMYKEFEIDRDQGNFDKLPELHAVLSGMKAGPLTAFSSHLCALVI